MSPTLHACREQIADPGDARGGASGTALGGSLLLHLGVIGVIFFRQPDPALPQLPQPETSMVVSLASYNPQLERAPLPANIDINTENPVEQKSPQQPFEVIAPAEEVSEGRSADADQTPASSATAQDSEQPGNQTVENTGVPGISPAEITTSVTAYVTNYKRSLTSDWLSACLQYQNEHGVKTCPLGEDGKSETTKAVNETTSRLFATYVGGTAANIRVSKKLLEEMDAVRPFLNENSVMGELARQRYELAEANYCQLNSCRGFASKTMLKDSLDASFNTPESNEGRITIAGFGNEGGGPSILSGLMSFMPGPKPAKPVVQFVPYRFTATGGRQAESEAEFKVAAPVFPVSR